MTIPSERIPQIIEFWFGSIPIDNSFYNFFIDESKNAKFFQKDLAFDNEIKELFLPEITQATQGHLDIWQQTHLGSLVLFILLDQFHRNVFRGTPESFSGDFKALQNCLQGIENNYDKQYIPWVRMNYYLPLMHSEDLSMQNLCLEKLNELSEEFKGTPVIESIQNFYKFANMHKAIIEKYGRFPHRNQILGRTSTQEELEFLSGPNSGF